MALSNSARKSGVDLISHFGCGSCDPYISNTGPLLHRRGWDADPRTLQGKQARRSDGHSFHAGITPQADGMRHSHAAKVVPLCLPATSRRAFTRAVRHGSGRTQATLPAIKTLPAIMVNEHGNDKEVREVPDVHADLKTSSAFATWRTRLSGRSSSRCSMLNLAPDTVGRKVEER